VSGSAGLLNAGGDPDVRTNGGAGRGPDGAEPVTAARGKPPRPLLKVLQRPIVAVGTATFALIALVALLAPLLTPYGPNDLDIINRLQAPNAAHPMGTDDLGRDVWSRVVHGARLSLLVGLATAFCAATIGTLISLLAG